MPEEPARCGASPRMKKAGSRDHENALPAESRSSRQGLRM